MQRTQIKRGLNRIILLPIVLSALYAGVLIWQLGRMIDEGEWVGHTTRVISLSNDAQKHIALQEGALRGFLLTADPSFSQQFRQEDAVVDTTFQLLHQAVLDNATQTRRLDSILQTYWSWQASARHRIVAREQPRNDSDIYQRSGYVSIMREMFNRFNADEQQLYLNRQTSFKKGTTILTISIAAFSLLLGLVIGAGARRETRSFIRTFSETLDEARANRDLLQTTLLSIGDAIIVTDSSSRVTLMNPRAESLTGWEQADAFGRRIDEVFHIVQEGSRTPVENPVRVVLREGRTVELSNHTLLIGRKGLEYPIDDSAAPIHNSRRELIGVVLVFRDISVRKENEDESRQREREFRALIENAPDVIIRYNRELRITYVNPAVEHMLGIAPNALIGRRFREVGIPEAVYAPWEKAVRDVFQMQRSISTEIDYQTLHGFRHYQARLVPETDEHGIESVISISRDITDIKKTEDRLRNSEQRFRGVVENSPDAFYLLKAVRNTTHEIVDFTFEYINSKGASLIAIDPQELLGKRLRDTLSNEGVDRFLETYQHVIDTQIPAVEEYQVRSNLVRQAQWLRSQYVPIGENLAITTIDISERKRTEESLRGSEERYRRLVDNASEAIFSTDPEGRITYANPFVRDLSGYTEEDVCGIEFTELVSPEYRTRVKRHFYRQFLSRTPYSYIESPFIAKSGEERWLAVTTSLLMRGNDVEGFDCIATDLTEKKREELLLRQAVSRAEATAKATTRKISHLAREIRLPVNSILSASRLLAQGKFPTDLQEAAARIELHAQRIAGALRFLDHEPLAAPSSSENDSQTDGKSNQ